MTEQKDTTQHNTAAEQLIIEMLDTLEEEIDDYDERLTEILEKPPEERNSRHMEYIRGKLDGLAMGKLIIEMDYETKTGNHLPKEE